MIERSIAFGPGNGLVGTICLPEAGAARPAVGQVLFNAGVVHRVGPHRINVRLARALARRGIPSIRFDLSGQGDSARPRGDLPFEGQAVEDLRASMDALTAASGAQRHAIFGFCSGGCHGYATAQADERVAGLVLYDTYIYPTPRSRLNRALTPIREKGVVTFTLGVLRRLLAARWLLGRDPKGAFDRQGNVGYFRLPTKAEFARTVRALHDRGTRVALMYSCGFPAYNYAGQFRDAFRGTGIDGIVSCDYFQDMGHSATVTAAQARFIERLVEFAAGLEPPKGRAPQ